MPRALVVDDQDDVRLLLHHILQADGFTVVEAGGGPEALALLDSGERPDVVILDVQMPDMDGWTTLAEMRRRARYPVLLCTVKSSLADVVRGYELGCDGYLAKPFHPPELVEAVHSVLMMSEAERAAARAEELRQARRVAALIH
jgi:two-component system KDP operon response regulator KdpE